MTTTSNTSASNAFYLLDERIQKWMWQAGWTELRDAQERAVSPVLSADRDVIIAAATAAGKTEAAFLPILTKILQTHEQVCVLYISPLKALINDQWDRLDGLCSTLEIAVTPWHGDITGSRKHRFLKHPSGILLITPESLEALLMNKGHGIAGLFSGLCYIVIDELHAFIGTERGKQLQSQLHRLEFALKRYVPRIGLSATLGDMKLAADYLRADKDKEVELIVSRDEGQELKVQVRGYVDRPPLLSDKDIQIKLEQGESVELEDTLGQSYIAIASHLFKTLRGSNNLIFPNSRGHVERYADLLRRLSERQNLPNEFWPHHGSLSKDIREETETALKQKERPASAICTTTLELGIDIGSVKSIAQIGPAPSVASLRQRLGRSGRREGEPAILRCYCSEPELTPDSTISDLLHEGLIQSIAQIRLLTQGWFEPPLISGMHLSTLIQQLLSAIAQYGGLTAGQAWHLLCETGPFQQLSKADLTDLFRALGKHDVLMQDAQGLLLYGQLGERLANHYTFYAAFSTEDEFRLVTEGRALGSIPVSKPLQHDSHIIFAGRRWGVCDIDLGSKVIEVIPDKGGKPPDFDGAGGRVHDRVRAEMRQILQEQTEIPFLNQEAANLLREARNNYRLIGLDAEDIIPAGSGVRLFPWKGDWVLDTLFLAMKYRGYKVENEGLCLYIKDIGINHISDSLYDFSEGAFPTESELASGIINKLQHKWDWLLPDNLLKRNYVSHNLDITGTIHYLSELVARYFEKSV